MKLKKVVDSFNHAINGIIDTVRTQRNMKIHLVAAIGVLIACFCLSVNLSIPSTSLYNRNFNAVNYMII